VTTEPPFTPADVRYERRMTRLVRWQDADHGKHPETDHFCRCCCTNYLSMDCPEHGDQVPTERREITTIYGPWLPVVTEVDHV